MQFSAAVSKRVCLHMNVLAHTCKSFRRHVPVHVFLSLSMKEDEKETIYFLIESDFWNRQTGFGYPGSQNRDLMSSVHLCNVVFAHSIAG
jgi:hypothetical protein